MAAPRGYKKTTGQKGKTYFYDKPKSKDTKIENKLPKGMTTEQFNAKYSKVVWCDYYKCIHNEQPEGLKRTIATLLNNEDAMIHGVCNKSEIGIKFKELKTSGGIKHKVPECFNAADNKNKGGMDFSKLVQSDGSPYGGSIESGNADSGWSNAAYM